MIFSQTQVSFTKPELAALLACASTDITRPHLGAVLFDATARRAVATDGTTLAMCEGEGDRGTWGHLAARTALDTAVKMKGAVTFILTPATCDIAVMGKDNVKIATFDAPAANGSPVPYRQVMGRDPDLGAPDTTRVRQALDPRLLLRVVGMAAAAGAAFVRFYPGEHEGDPMQFRAGAWTVLIMPWRLDAAGQAAEQERDKAVIAANKASRKTSNAIVLASAPSMPAEPSGPVVVVNAASLGSDAFAALPQASKSRSREWRETYASTADHVNPETLRAWVEDADALPSSTDDRPPWG